MVFGVAEEEVTGMDSTKGLGLIGNARGNVRGPAVDTTKKSKLCKIEYCLSSIIDSLLFSV